MEQLAKLRFPILVLCLIVATGTIGYILLYHVSLVDAFYMTVITISTVGFREVVPLDDRGKIFTAVLVLFGLGGITFTASYLFQFLIEGHLMGIMRRRRMEKAIESLSGHAIICGYGRVGRQIAMDFQKAGKPFVVVDENESIIQHLEEKGYLYVLGNATSDETLKKAGIERASGLVACTDSDPDNVLITLSARLLNPDIFIVARANSEEVFEKLYKTGANRVVCPYLSTGQKIATMLLKPLIHDYLDTMAYGTDLEIQLQEMEIPAGTGILGKTIQEAALRKRTGATILAVKKADGRTVTNPPVSTVLEEGDHLILVGTAEQLDHAGREILSPDEKGS